MRRKLLVSAIIVLFLVSTIPVQADESTGIDLARTEDLVELWGYIREGESKDPSRSNPGEG